MADAVRLALSRNKSLEAASAATGAAKARIDEARAGLMPRVSYSESWTRSDNPVFVFGSLLSQHQFTEGDFQLGPLNRPDFLNNFRSLVSADQVLYNGGRTSRAIHSAELGRDLSAEDARRAQMDVIAAVIRAYYDAVLTGEQAAATAQALQSAQADLDRAQSLRDAGMATDADVLSIRVHLADVREQQIRRQADAEVARAALNDALGLPLDTPHQLTTPLAAAAQPDQARSGRETTAIEQRPEARQAKLMTSLAETQAADARSKLLPEVSIHGAFEADRQRFYDRGGANWLVSAGLEWNLFNGFADKARIEETRASVTRSAADAARADSAIRLEVRRAAAALRAASERIEVSRASVAEAEESLRITQNRYEAGLANVTELLRTETALLEARIRSLAAVRDQRVAAAVLELASGTLTPDSPVVQERN